mmetsp:Transcript_27529/g.92022  ORF Transcript_27529/g.92022 Transcript_27529/m.92022 type:complete len:231 (+) Transcript_27529:231-923(+)
MTASWRSPTRTSTTSRWATRSARSTACTSGRTTSSPPLSTCPATLRPSLWRSSGGRSSRRWTRPSCTPSARCGPTTATRPAPCAASPSRSPASYPGATRHSTSPWWPRSVPRRAMWLWSACSATASLAWCPWVRCACPWRTWGPARRRRACGRCWPSPTAASCTGRCSAGSRAATGRAALARRRTWGACASRATACAPSWQRPRRPWPRCFPSTRRCLWIASRTSHSLLS